MCFSAEASFTVGAVLTAIGAGCLKKAKDKTRIPIALIPVLFGLQQLAEGFVWLNVNGEFQPTAMGTVAMYVFLSFAWVIWPVWVPISFAIPERAGWRMAVCALSLVAGVIVSYVDIRYMVEHDFTPEVVGNSLSYPPSNWKENILYSLSIIPPLLVSSIPKMWIFGSLVLISYFAAQMIWALTFTSVWCFFCAAVSLVLLKVLAEDANRTHDL